MNPHLEKRIERIEAALLPPPAKKVRMLIEPQESATEDERATFAAELADAKASCDLVIIVGAIAPARPFEESGCLIVGTKTEAQLAILASQRSERGNANRLADILENLPGKVMSVASNPPPGQKTW